MQWSGQNKQDTGPLLSSGPTRYALLLPDQVRLLYWFMPRVQKDNLRMCHILRVFPPRTECQSIPNEASFWHAAHSSTKLAHWRISWIFLRRHKLALYYNAWLMRQTYVHVDRRVYAISDQLHTHPTDAGNSKTWSWLHCNERKLSPSLLSYKIEHINRYWKSGRLVSSESIRSFVCEGYVNRICVPVSVVHTEFAGYKAH